MAGEEVVGGILGYLRLDADQFQREITKALALIKVLDGQDVKVDVKTNSQSVEKDLARVSRAAKTVGRDVDGMSSSFKGLRDPRLIVGAIAGGMALIGPVTGAATAAMGGFVGVVGTGILAFKGFQSEIEKGTALGQYLQGSLEGVKSEFAALGSTAASAMSGDVLSALSQVRRFLPTINDDVESLAGHLGGAFNISTKGLLTGLRNAMPLLQDGGRYAEFLAQKFADFAASKDFKDFVDYARRELPVVGSAVMSLVGGIKDLAVSLAPAGDDLVSIIGLLGKMASAVAPAVGALTKLSQVPILGSGLHTLALLNDQIDKWTGSNKNAAGAVDEHTTHLLTLQQVTSSTATALGTTDTALQAALTAQKAHTQAAADATLQMQVEGDAAGLLKQQLDKLNGKAITAASAQNSFDSALANSNTHIAANGKTIDRATTSLAGNSAAAVANRGELIRQVTAAEGVATAMRDNGASQDETRAKMVKMRDEIIANAKQHGLNAGAVQKFIDKIYQIPKKVAPTKIEVETAAAMSGITAFQRAIDALHGKKISIHATYSYDGKLPNGGRSTAGGTTFADGGIMGKGGVRAMADGDVLGRNAMIRTGTKPILWNEAGPEAYIPLSPSKRPRSERILAETNRLMGNPLGGGGVTELGASTIAAIAAAVSRVQLKTTVSTGRFDSAMAVAL